ncbi:MAG: hypothetical protein ACLQME_20655 [Alphaproteobacteria bacterium]
MEISTGELRAAPERLRGAAATPAQSAPLKESFQGKTVREGVVHVLGLEGNAKASRTDAWSSPIEDGTKRWFLAVLHSGAVRGPLEAVKAAIEAEHRGER